MGEILKRVYQEAEEQKERENMRILDEAYFMYTLKFLKDNEKQYREYARANNNKEEYKNIEHIYHTAYHDMVCRLKYHYGQDLINEFEEYVYSYINNTLENAYDYLTKQMEDN